MLYKNIQNVKNIIHYSINLFALLSLIIGVVLMVVKSRLVMGYMPKKGYFLEISFLELEEKF